MSMFLPDGPYQTQPPSGVADITPANPETTTADIALMQRVLSAASRNVNLIPSDFMAYVVDFIQTSRLQIPIGQVFGFRGFTVQVAPIIGQNESTSIAYPSYADLTTEGPELTGLANGSYVFWFGAQAKNTAGDSALMGLSLNGSTPDNQTSCATNMTNYTQISRAYNATLNNNDNNTVKAQYSAGISGGTSSFSLRYLYALKYANL